MPRASVQQSEAKEEGERSSRVRPGRVQSDQRLTAACQRHGKKSVSTCQAC